MDHPVRKRDQTTNEEGVEYQLYKTGNKELAGEAEGPSYSDSKEINDKFGLTDSQFLNELLRYVSNEKKWDKDSLFFVSKKLLSVDPSKIPFTQRIFIPGIFAMLVSRSLQLKYKIQYTDKEIDKFWSFVDIDYSDRSIDLDTKYNILNGALMSGNFFFSLLPKISNLIKLLVTELNVYGEKRVANQNFNQCLSTAYSRAALCGLWKEMIAVRQYVDPEKIHGKGYLKFERVYQLISNEVSSSSPIFEFKNDKLPIKSIVDPTKESLILDKTLHLVYTGKYQVNSCSFDGGLNSNSIFESSMLFSANGFNDASYNITKFSIRGAISKVMLQSSSGESIKLYGILNFSFNKTQLFGKDKENNKLILDLSINFNDLNNVRADGKFIKITHSFRQDNKLDKNIHFSLNKIN